MLILANADKYQIESLSSDDDSIFVKIENHDIKIVVGLMYSSPGSDIDRLLNELNKKICDIHLQIPNYSIIIGGDFNGKIGNLNQFEENFIFNNANIFNHRSTLDYTENKRGIKITEFFENEGFFVLNGRTQSDNPAQFTYAEKAVPSSDHFPICISLANSNLSFKENNIESLLKWQEENVEKYKDIIKYPIRTQSPATVEEISDNLIVSIKEAAKNSNMITTKTKKRVSKPWYDSECNICKKNLKDP